MIHAALLRGQTIEVPDRNNFTMTELAHLLGAPRSAIPRGVLRPLVSAAASCAGVLA